MQLTARNVLFGRVTQITPGKLISLVTINVCGSALTSTLPNEELRALGLRVGSPARATLSGNDLDLSVRLGASGRIRSRQMLASAS